MTIGVGQKVKATTAGATSVTTAGVATSASGSTFVLAVVTRSAGGGTFVSIGDNKSNSYSIIGSEQISGGGFVWCRLYRCENAAGGAGHTFTVTVSGSQEITLFALEITGAAAASFDKTNQASDATSPYNSGSTPTTGQANELIVGFLGGDSGSNPATHTINNSTPSAGSWTIQLEETDGSTLWTGAFATAIVSATGAYQAGFTESGAVEGVVFTATFKEAAATPPLILADSPPSRNRPGRGPFSTGKYFRPDSSAFTAPTTVTATLIGSSLTFTAGSLTPSLAAALSGQAAGFATGVLAPTDAATLTGQVISFAAGSVSAGGDVTVSLTGQLVSFSAGALTPGASVALSGQMMSFPAGTLTPSSAVNLAGIAGTFVSGSLLPDFSSVALAGQALSFSTGSLSASSGGDVTLALAGAVMAFSMGAVVPSGGQAVSSDFLLRLRRKQLR